MEKAAQKRENFYLQIQPHRVRIKNGIALLPSYFLFFQCRRPNPTSTRLKLTTDWYMCVDEHTNAIKLDEPSIEPRVIKSSKIKAILGFSRPAFCVANE